MSYVSRRQAFGAITAGAVIAAGAKLSVAVPVHGQADSPIDSLPDWMKKQIAKAASQLQRNIAPPSALPAALATVSYCRSWDSTVYVFINEYCRGFVVLGSNAFAIAIACQSANQPVAIRAWGHDQNWGEGAGRFEGAMLALNLQDLPTDPVPMY